VNNKQWRTFTDWVTTIIPIQITKTEIMEMKELTMPLPTILFSAVGGSSRTNNLSTLGKKPFFRW
jgi:hypothetical protein